MLVKYRNVSYNRQKFLYDYSNIFVNCTESEQRRANTKIKRRRTSIRFRANANGSDWYRSSEKSRKMKSCDRSRSTIALKFRSRKTSRKSFSSRILYWIKTIEREYKSTCNWVARKILWWRNSWINWWEKRSEFVFTFNVFLYRMNLLRERIIYFFETFNTDQFD